jgi:cob(I)alamin adenosyltransferase
MKNGFIVDFPMLTDIMGEHGADDKNFGGAARRSFEAMKAKIYTKTGDKGQTSLVGGTRVAKTDIRLKAYGTLDELNSVLGIVRGALPSSAEALGDFGRQVEASLQVVQNNLFNIGSHLACEDAKLAAQLPALSVGGLESLEKEMDTWEAELPPLKNFILPGGSLIAGYAHLARTVCRRAERETLVLSETADVANEFIVYLNRLSDWLFLLAREFNFRLKQPEFQWQKG